MTTFQRLLPLILVASASTAWTQPAAREPHIGYLYPAGGQQGSVVQTLVGGQFLRGLKSVDITGEGVQARVIQYAGPLNNKQIKEIRTQLGVLLRVRRAEERNLGSSIFGDITATAMATVTLPSHPLLRNVADMPLKELEHWARLYFNPKKRQSNAQLAEVALVEVRIEPGGEPGDRELRLETPGGLSNPLCFQVGQLPEACEREPNDPQAYPVPPGEPPLELPVLVNGQIMPGDVDRFRFRARQGQRLVMQTQARHLIPYLADAVPGWFQPTLALYDAEGKPLDFADDYRFDPDPVLLWEVPADGEYEFEIRDSIFRGREDFVYRVAIGEEPFVTQVFPLGAREGTETVVKIDGWNLPEKSLTLDTRPQPDEIRQTASLGGKHLINPIRYAVDNLPESAETEPNNIPGEGQRVELPQVINGRIEPPGDVDVFRFEGRAGDEVVAEIIARRLDSPLDSLLRLTDDAGAVVAWNDDHAAPNTGLLTHHADSYLCAKLPGDGSYCVSVSDAQGHGAAEYGYRLRLTAPRPDFELRATPSTLNLRPGRAAPLCVHALRKEGFDGPIEVMLKDAPAGFTVNGGVIPAGRDRIRITVTAPPQPLDHPVILQLEGQARLGDQLATRPVTPAEDLMQAFLYRHLVPCQNLIARVTGPGRRPSPPVRLIGAGPVSIPAGGTAEVRVRTPKNDRMGEIQLELSEAPAGITLQEYSAAPPGLRLVLKADAEVVKPGYADNLIVGAFAEPANPDPNAKPAKQKRRVSLGVLPAIPFEIVP
jgi:hypothetical protein